MSRYPLQNHRQRTLVALAVLAIVALTASISFASPIPQSHTINVNSRAFAYEPASIRVNRGDTVTIRLESLDATHGLAIDGYDVSLQAEPGSSARATFVADREGKFKFRCSVSCGPLHPFMIGELVVQPDLPFARSAILTLLVTLGALVWFWQPHSVSIFGR